MDFLTFAEHAETIENKSSDTEIINATATLLSETATNHDTDTLEIVTRFIQGRTFPAWGEQKLDIGNSLLYESLARAASSGTTADTIEEQKRDIGEIGEVANQLTFGEQTGLGSFGATEDTGTLTVKEVADELENIATMEGSGSTNSKINALFGLFNDATPLEARYLSRIVVEKMRIGVGEGTVRDAILKAFFENDADVMPELERALQVSNDYGYVAVVSYRDGVDGLQDIELEVGRAVQSMLAQTGTASDAINKWGTVVVEEKYDGARAQVHYDGEDEVHIFSRRQEEVTDAIPEVAEYVKKHIDTPVILDGEVIAIENDGSSGEYENVLRRFRRKDRVYEMRQQFPVRFRPFDCLFSDGEVLFNRPLTERQSHLQDVYPEEHISEILVTESEEEIAAFEQEALEKGEEGIMLKNPDAGYDAGKRGSDWLKLKPDVETLDLAIIGGEWGDSRRGGWIGSILLGARVGPDEYKEIGKVGTGLSDEQLAELTEKLEPHIIEEDGVEVTFDPNVIVEVGYEKIQESPTYESGYALRFPRFIGYRDDKSLDEVDSVERVERLKDKK